MDMTFENNQKSEEREKEKDKSKEKEQTNYDTYDNLLIENMSL